MNWWDDYPYLTGNLISIPFFIAAFLKAGRQRSMMILAGLCALPLMVVPLLDSQTDGYYWRPKRVGDLPVGIEDVLFLFQAGGATWFLASWRTQPGELDIQHIRPGFGRTVALLMIGMAATVGLQMSGASFMSAAFLGPSTVMCYLLIARWDLWRLALFGCFGYSVIYYVHVIAVIAMWPHILDEATMSGELTRPILGVPVGEWFWAIIFGAIHPLLMAYAFRVRHPPCAQRETAE